MKKPEILAPVGSKESLIAAVMAGCDAVYLGGYMFGARSFASNFSDEEMISSINYAHLYGVKVYVTVNTIIFDSEVEMFMEYIDFLHKNNVDAIILQDLGMVDLVHKTYPNLELHASTQMHIHNLEGVLMAEKLGVKRCVIARETSIDDLKYIKENTSMPLEVFVHGALCISYSGQCLFSSMIGGRSGNRGTCAQSCRQLYSFKSDENISDEAYLLSAKDLNTINNIGSLVDIGIDSIKIEGRMKRPEYVYLIVSLYKKAIENYMEFGKTNISDSDILEMKKIFNREFTKGFLFNEENNKLINSYRPNHMGITIGKVVSFSKKTISIKLTTDLNLNDGIRVVSKEDFGCNVTKMLIGGKPVLKASSGDVVEIFIDGEFEVGNTVLKTTDYNQLTELNKKIDLNDRKVLISGEFKGLLNNEISLKISDGLNEVCMVSDYVVTPAVKTPTTFEQVNTQLSKLGDSIYSFSELSVDLDDNIFIPLVALNEIRRKSIDELNNKRLYKTGYVKSEYNIVVPDFLKSKKISYLINEEFQYDLIKDKKYDTLYLEKNLFSKINDDKKVLKLDRVINNYDESNEKVLIGEIGSLYKYKTIDTDFSFNVTNIYTVALLHSLGVDKVTLSYELNDNQIKELIETYKNRFNKHPNLEVIVYAKEELMINKFDLNNYFKSSDKGLLVDRFKNEYPVYSSSSFMRIYNYKPRDLNPSIYYAMGINNIRYNLTDETAFK